MYNRDACMGHATKELFKSQLTLGINTRGLYINKGGSLLFDIINIPFFFLFLPEEYTFTFK